MITDTLDNLGKYAALNPLIELAAEFVQKNDLNALADGKYPIKGEELFLNVQTVRAKTREEATLETHRLMLDIQIPLSESETYGYTPLADLPDAEYDPEKDLTKYPGVKSGSYMTCRPGTFVIFLPQDGHAPCIAEGENIRKAIFKAKV